MCTLIIFTNNTSLQTINTDFILLENSNIEEYTINSINILLIKDDIGCDKQNQLITKSNFINDNTKVYIHLHTTRQKGELQDWRKEYSQVKANVEIGSHDESGGFYQTIIPKIVDTTLKEEDIPPFFVDTKLEDALETLCSTWATTDFNNQTEIDALAVERDTSLNQLV